MCLCWYVGPFGLSFFLTPFFTKTDPGTTNRPTDQHWAKIPWDPFQRKGFECWSHPPTFDLATNIQASASLPQPQSPPSSHDPASTQAQAKAIHPRRPPPACRAGRRAAHEVAGCRIQPPKAPQVLEFPTLQGLVHGAIDQIRG